jgi:hypothetical protein
MANKFIDFALVKKEVPFADAIELLDLRMKFAANQWRGDCPACGTKDGRSLVITADRGFFCHSDDSGGDVIGLAKHVLDLPTMRDAAFELADRAGISNGTRSTRDTVPSNRSRERQEPESGRRPNVAQSRGAEKSAPHQSRPAFDSKDYASKLDYEHEMLTEVGADPEKMRECGIGYQPKGIHRGKIVIRVTDEAGDEHFVAVEGITLPPTLKLNVVPFKKRA